jgi:hypothetical protein
VTPIDRISTAIGEPSAVWLTPVTVLTGLVSVAAVANVLLTSTTAHAYAVRTGRKEGSA